MLAEELSSQANVVRIQDCHCVVPNLLVGWLETCDHAAHYCPWRRLDMWAAGRPDMVSRCISNYLPPCQQAISTHSQYICRGCKAWCAFTPTHHPADPPGPARRILTTAGAAPAAHIPSCLRPCPWPRTPKGCAPCSRTPCPCLRPRSCPSQVCTISSMLNLHLLQLNAIQTHSCKERQLLAAVYLMSTPWLIFAAAIAFYDIAYILALVGCLPFKFQQSCAQACCAGKGTYFVSSA